MNEMCIPLLHFVERKRHQTCNSLIIINLNAIVYKLATCHSSDLCFKIENIIDEFDIQNVESYVSS